MISTLTKSTSGDTLIDRYSVNKDFDKIKELIDVSMQENLQ